MEMENNIIEQRVTALIQRYRGRFSINETLGELVLSEGKPEYFKKKVQDIKQEMFKGRGIAGNWIANGCLEITHKDWLSEVIRMNLKTRPENEVWEEAEQFVKQYFCIKEFEKHATETKKKNKVDTIIEIERLALMYRKYKEYFKEPENQWIKRFVYPSETTINPIDINKRALNGSDRLVLLAILASIQILTGNGFDYNNFVFDRFGIRNYQKAKSDHKNKQTYIDTLKECNSILRK